MILLTSCASPVPVKKYNVIHTPPPPESVLPSLPAAKFVFSSSGAEDVVPTYIFTVVVEATWPSFEDISVTNYSIFFQRKSDLSSEWEDIWIAPYPTNGGTFNYIYTTTNTSVSEGYFRAGSRR